MPSRSGALARVPPGAVVRKVEGLSDEQARWTPNGSLISVVGIVNHLTHE